MDGYAALVTADELVKVEIHVTVAHAAAIPSPPHLQRTLACQVLTVLQQCRSLQESGECARSRVPQLWDAMLQL